DDSRAPSVPKRVLVVPAAALVGSAAWLVGLAAPGRAAGLVGLAAPVAAGRATGLIGLAAPDRPGLLPLLRGPNAREFPGEHADGRMRSLGESSSACPNRRRGCEAPLRLGLRVRAERANADSLDGRSRGQSVVAGHIRRPLNGRGAPGGSSVRVLVVEDDPAIAKAVEAGLAGEGWATDVVGNGREALAWAAQYPYDVVLLDVVLPGMSGLEVCSGLRAAGVAAPVLMVTALDAVDDRVTGLDLGADDYLAKPFAMAELLARIRALRRRQVPDRGPALRVADLEIEPATRAVTRSGKPVLLTSREFAL